MAQKEGHRQRKFGRHDRGLSHHTPEQALRNKAKRVLKSSGLKAFRAYCEEHRLIGLLNRIIKAG